MNQQMSNMDLFNYHFDTIDNSVEYNHAWTGSTGYLADAVMEGTSYVVNFPKGVVKVKCVDHVGRKMIFLKTIFGPIVVFQRFPNGHRGVVVNNQALRLKQTELIHSGSMDYNAVRQVLGDQYDYPDINVVLGNLQALRFISTAKFK